MFSWGSQVLLQDLPNSTSDLSHMVCPKFNSHAYKLKRWASVFVTILWLGSPKRCLYSECPSVPKELVMDQSTWLFKTFLSPFFGCFVLLTFGKFSSYGSFQKERKMLWAHPWWTHIINTNPTMFHSIGKYSCNCLVRYETFVTHGFLPRLWETLPNDGSWLFY
jgi:hypothetical protein